MPVTLGCAGDRHRPHPSAFRCCGDPCRRRRVPLRGDTHKLFAEIDGRPVISHVVDAARASEVDEVIVVGGAVDLDSFVPDDVTLIHNEQWADGQATSLRAAVGYAESRRHDALVVGLGDSPGVTTEIWNKVAEVDADLARLVTTANCDRRFASAPRCGHRSRSAATTGLVPSCGSVLTLSVRSPSTATRAISTRSRTSAGGAERLVHRRLSDR